MFKRNDLQSKNDDSYRNLAGRDPGEVAKQGRLLTGVASAIMLYAVIMTLSSKMHGVLQFTSIIVLLGLCIAIRMQYQRTLELQRGKVVRGTIDGLKGGGYYSILKLREKVDGSFLLCLRMAGVSMPIIYELETLDSDVPDYGIATPYGNVHDFETSTGEKFNRIEVKAHEKQKIAQEAAETAREREKEKARKPSVAKNEPAAETDRVAPTFRKEKQEEGPQEAARAETRPPPKAKDPSPPRSDIPDFILRASADQQSSTPS